MFASLVFRQAAFGKRSLARMPGCRAMTGGAEGVREGHEGPGVAAVRRASARARVARVARVARGQGSGRCGGRRRARGSRGHPPS